MHVSGLGLTGTQIGALTDALRQQGAHRLATELRSADGAGVHDVELTLDERDAVVRALEHGPAELAGFRAALLRRSDRATD